MDNLHYSKSSNLKVVYKNIAVRSSQIFSTFVLRVEIFTIFEPKVVAISARNTIIQKICKLCKAIFCTHYNIFNQIVEFHYF